MPTTSYPGVYIEERPGGPSPIQGVSTSTLALVGFTLEGPTDEATLVTSMGEFRDTFGDFTADGLVPTQAHAFFKNGGAAAYIVRVVGDNAAAAASYLSESYSDIASGFTGDGAATAASWTIPNTPVEPGSFVSAFERRITAEVLGAGTGAQTVFPAMLANIPTSAVITVTWTTGAATKTGTFTGTTWASSEGSTVGVINRATGALQVTLTGSVPDNATNVTVAYNYSTAITDDGAGALVGVTGTIDYATGAVVISVFPSAPRNGNAVLYGYGNVLWQVDMAWAGVKGNSYRWLLFGTPGYEDDSAASFAGWTLLVQKLQADGTYITKETFEALDFTTSTAARFVTSVVNAERGGSKIIKFVDVGNSGVPSTLSGSEVTGEVLGTGNGSTAAFTGTLAGISADGLHPGTLTITSTRVTAAQMVVRDDGSGHLIGDVSGSGVNTIDYATGAYNVTFAGNVVNGVDVTADYYSEPTNDQDAPVIEVMTGGDDGNPVTSSQVTAAPLEADYKGLYALNRVDDLLLVGLPDFAGSETMDNALVDYCEQRKDRFAILATPGGLTVQERLNYKRFDLNRSTSYAALYAPWVIVQDPVSGAALAIPPIGHVAGVYARTDNAKNVGKAPAGVDDGRLRFAIGLEEEFTQTQVGLLYQQRINPIVAWPQLGGVTVWGARTLEQSGEFGYIQARRLFQFVEKSVYNATHGFVFENNGSDLWARVSLQVGAFLLRLFGQGYFAGDTPSDGFFLVCDATNNPQVNIDAGILTIDVGIAPNKPAEFIVFRFQQFSNS